MKVLDTIGKEKKVILVLGDIKRLGNFEEKYHREIGTMVAQRNIHMLMTIGSKAQEIAIKRWRKEQRQRFICIKMLQGF